MRGSSFGSPHQTNTISKGLRLGKFSSPQFLFSCYLRHMYGVTGLNITIYPFNSLRRRREYLSPWAADFSSQKAAFSLSTGANSPSA